MISYVSVDNVILLKICSTPDDIFLTYAAMFCGPNTKLVSNDTWQDDVANLGPEAAPLMTRWQKTQRIHFESLEDLLKDINGEKVSFFQTKLPSVDHGLFFASGDLGVFWHLC